MDLYAYCPLPPAHSGLVEVSSISFSANGNFIAAAGNNALSIFRIPTSRLASISPFPFFSLTLDSPITCMRWVYFKETRSHVLVLGLKDGEIVALGCDKHAFKIIKRRTISQQSICSIAARKIEVKPGLLAEMAITLDDGSITTLTISYAGLIAVGFSSPFGPDVPDMIRYCSNTGDILVFSRSCHKMYRLHSTSGKALCEYDISSTPLWKSEVYDLESHCTHEVSHIRVLDCNVSAAWGPQGAVFGEDETILLAGTNFGKAFVFDASSGEMAQVLDYPQGGEVHALATSTSSGFCLIAISRSSPGCPAEIVIFQKTKSTKPKRRQDSNADLPLPTEAQHDSWTKVVAGVF
ncbi:hypothetical protein K435DRAFT_860937 [Dendrothele bispora CBS 962.96]|uniref:WD40 repeat-like protein n=1 Tax=Dendrothele bispora (strain CBS 962.96) TaxID=1314807 RepID=A0A4S8LWF6_DENBC|nr:hypothetical protein K435DRAFT_860937 [Dendrothele bispora CBS 962.96]